MDELVFLVEAAPEGGFTARALGAAIFTEADDRETLRQFILDAVDCHYEPEERPRLVRLHFVQDEVVAREARSCLGMWGARIWPRSCNVLDIR